MFGITGLYFFPFFFYSSQISYITKTEGAGWVWAWCGRGEQHFKQESYSCYSPLAPPTGREDLGCFTPRCSGSGWEAFALAHREISATISWHGPWPSRTRSPFCVSGRTQVLFPCLPSSQRPQVQHRCLTPSIHPQGC